MRWSTIMLRLMSHVPRWSIVPVQKPQTIDGHSYFVVLYTWQICTWLGMSIRDRAAAIEYAIFHDMPELRTSDMPGPVKRQVVNPDLMDSFEYETMEMLGLEVPQVRSELKDIVKLADIWDATAYLAMECGAGNMFVRDLFEHHYDALTDGFLKWRINQGEQVLKDLQRAANGMGFTIIQDGFGLANDGSEEECPF